uniref:Uncharacterized protein n=1 Tax=Ignisphaera aggregans TaxID=334771 RepID=A0A7C4FG36_9CREN
MRNSGFIDRVHGVMLGWRLLKIRYVRHCLSQGYGIASDYFAEVLYKMRKENLEARIGHCTRFSDNFIIGDERAVKKIASGLLKQFSLPMAREQR